ncbi:MAG: hypothetical protein KGQ41_03320 [Alphaproteobacteria bacterium]|nr:hypothetical protein [Alphaproteobacteria bacterium]
MFREFRTSEILSYLTNGPYKAEFPTPGSRWRELSNFVTEGVNCEAIRPNAVDPRAAITKAALLIQFPQLRGLSSFPHHEAHSLAAELGIINTADETQLEVAEVYYTKLADELGLGKTMSVAPYAALPDEVAPKTAPKQPAKKRGMSLRL